MSIRNKILTSFLVLSLLAGLLGGFVYYHYIDEASHSAKHEAISIANTFSLFILSGLSDIDNTDISNYQGIQKEVMKFKQTQNRDIVIVDRGKSIIADAVPSEIGRVFFHDRNNEVGETLKDGQIRDFTEISDAYPQGIKQLVVPLRLEDGSIVGGLVLEYTPLYAEILGNAVSSAKKFLLIYMIVLIVPIILVFIFSRRISKALIDMNDAARSMIAGDLEAKVSYKAHDELGLLAVTFNKMVRHVRRTRESLIMSNRSLTREVNERKQAEERLINAIMKMEDEKAKTHAIIEGVGVGIIIQDVGFRVMYENEHQQKYFGNHVGELCYRAYGGRDDYCEDCPMLLSLRDGDIHKAERKVPTKKGYRYLELISTPLKDSSGEVIGGIKVVKDITDYKHMEETIKHQAYYDGLTSLPNRTLFAEQLKLEIASADRNNRKLAILFLDIDRFKNINDSLGHATGDNLLKNVAYRLRKCVRESDTVARIGGDEFVILLSGIAQKEDAAVTARKILDDFKRSYVIGRYDLHVSGSIGISIYPDDGQDSGDLIKNADIAMYHVKENGRGSFQFFNDEMNARISKRVVIENSIRQAVERNELVLLYQPMIDVTTNTIKGAEALIRWDHPKLGMLDPLDFLPTLEETEMIISIDEWVLQTATAQNRAWQDSGLPPIRVTVNLSSRQFQRRDFSEVIAGILDRSGLPPQFLDIEITENIAMNDVEMIYSCMTRLKDLGVTFSIDDFGTGYSSLSYLKKLPIQKLKIDKTFISDIACNHDSRAIINTIIGLAHNLKMEVVAEGVETPEQFTLLRSFGCDEMQGYLIGRPMPATALQEMLSGSTYNFSLP